MENIFQSLTKLVTGSSSDPVAQEQNVLPIKTVTDYRGKLALKRDRSQHRRYTVHYEDLQN
ncbi:hypothetical protein [Marivita hallyeonensis]|uniref:hypothetical protein n=1 Tax=Marivita hallyeonensis TaxID=996342 RepID=UPI0011606951|nr:hypothetical protein [Marivita hallyeonensis]